MAHATAPLLSLSKNSYFMSMTPKAPKYLAPSISETAFNCPHCGALAKQHWFELRADAKPKDELPFRLTEETYNRDIFKEIEDVDERVKLQGWVTRMIAGAPYIGRSKREYFGDWSVYMVDISQCFNCDQIAVWVKSALVYPLRGDAPLPNIDLPEDVRFDFDEAGRIFQISPRGAAALLRLAIQKLCKDLGGRGKNIDDDIALLVKNGLDIRVQRSLDIVRVIGNEAVHPGQVDLRDDIGTAEKLFALVNIIADALITQPKHIEEMYAGLPVSKRAAIERRDADNTSGK